MKKLVKGFASIVMFAMLAVGCKNATGGNNPAKEVKKYSLDCKVIDGRMKITNNGKEFLDGKVPEGTKLTFTVVAKEGYYVNSMTIDDGPHMVNNDETKKELSLDFVVTHDIKFTASCEKISLRRLTKLTIGAQTKEEGTSDYLPETIAFEKEAEANTLAVSYETNKADTIVTIVGENNSYDASTKQWTLTNNTENTLTITVADKTNSVSKKYTVKMNGAFLTYKVEPTVEHGTISVTTKIADETKTLTADELTKVRHGTVLVFMLKADEGYYASGLRIDDEHQVTNTDLAKTELALEITVSSDINVMGTVAAYPCHKVTITKDDHSIIKLYDVNKNTEITATDKIAYNTKVRVELTCNDAHYSPKELLVGSNSKKTGDAITEKLSDEIVVTGDVAVTASTEKTKFDITIGTVENGTISATQTNLIPNNTEVTFTLTPNEHYKGVKLVIDGTEYTNATVVGGKIIITHTHTVAKEITVTGICEIVKHEITFKGDERIDLQQTIEKPYNTAWSDIKAEIEGNIKPSADWKDDWNNGDYAFYEWRLGDENGEKITDGYTFTDDTTVYAVSNYMKWKIKDDASGNKVLSGVEGSKPRGKIIVPDNVSTIGYAFSYYSSLITTISIPASVTSIEHDAFSSCKNLKTLTVDSGNTNYKSVNNIIYTKDGKTLIFAAGGLTGTIDIPAGVTSIGKSAFNGCSALTGITIPASVTSIGGKAFYGCSSLTGITIPASVTSIGESAFNGCSALTGITIPASVTSIGESTFQWCSSLTGITIENGVTSIGKSAFYGCSRLTGITIPASVTSIGGKAFYDCSFLRTITIENGVTSIGWETFSNCTNLTSITIPKSVTSIGKGAFSGCPNLTSITIPNGVTSIEEETFSGCIGLTSITIPAGVTSIGRCAFSDCTRLKSITIPASVTSIGESAFQRCTRLETVVLPDDLTSIENFVFDSCSSLASITIPENVTEIGERAFYKCSSLTSITIPASVTYIRLGAFQDCSNLTYAKFMAPVGWKSRISSTVDVSTNYKARRALNDGGIYKET
ncbi:MAG: leucine-rich repeat protein [Treponemataceae bacterium]